MPKTSSITTFEAFCPKHNKPTPHRKYVDGYSKDGNKAYLRSTCVPCNREKAKKYKKKRKRH